MNHGLTGNKKKQLLFYLLLSSFAIIVYFMFDPESISLFPSCPFHSITGLYCPGCGSQRAIHDLLHANFLAAFSHNPLISLGVLTGCYKALLWLRYPDSRKAPNNLLYNKNTPWAILILIMSFWILRNVPGFSYLQP